jgi:hypothetical protein
LEKGECFFIENVTFFTETSFQIEASGDIPPPRSGHAMCQFGRHLLLFGGIDFENEAIYNDLYTLNLGNAETPSFS